MKASHRVTALPGEPWVCRGGMGPSGCSVLTVLQEEAPGSVLVDPTPGPPWLKPRTGEGRQAGGLQFVFLHVVSRFNFKVLVHAKFCVVRVHSSKLFFLKRMGIFKMGMFKINNLLSMYDTELLVQSHFIPQEFSEHLLNLCFI